MATQLVRFTWCDHHLQAKDEEVPGEGYTVTLNGTTWEIDLCADCAEPLLELRSWVELYGRVEGKQTQKGKRSAGISDEAEACPECGKWLSHHKGVKAHMLNIHDMTLEAWLAAHTDAPAPDKECPECGRVFSTAQGLRRHQAAQGH